MSEYQTISVERRGLVHVEEGVGTFGKRHADGVPRLYVEVRNEKGEVVYETWQNGPVENWRRVTLYFDRLALDGAGTPLGVSFWD